jgi:hypothetical protein
MSDCASNFYVLPLKLFALRNPKMVGHFPTQSYIIQKTNLLDFVGTAEFFHLFFGAHYRLCPSRPTILAHVLQVSRWHTTTTTATTTTTRRRSSSSS